MTLAIGTAQSETLAVCDGSQLQRNGQGRMDLLGKFLIRRRSHVDIFSRGCLTWSPERKGIP
jgi:hypothetical protein